MFPQHSPPLRVWSCPSQGQGRGTCPAVCWALGSYSRPAVLELSFPWPPPEMQTVSGVGHTHPLHPQSQSASLASKLFQLLTVFQSDLSSIPYPGSGASPSPGSPPRTEGSF